MASVVIRRWLPAVLVAGAGAVSLWARRRLPERVEEHVAQVRERSIALLRSGRADTPDPQLTHGEDAQRPDERDPEFSPRMPEFLVDASRPGARHEPTRDEPPGQCSQI